MDSKTKELVEALRLAMQGERTGYEFYKMAAANTKDPAGKATFEQFAAEEQGHFDFLAKHYRALHEKGALATGVTLGKAHELAHNHPIFSADLKARIRDSHFEMSALAIAVQLELNGINHYKAQAEKAQDPEARRFFQELVTWETAHYDAFVRQQQELQEAYWNDAGFSPF